MKKKFYLFLLLLSFFFVPRVYALDNYYLFNEDVSSPLITSSDNVSIGLQYVFKNSAFLTDIETYNAYYCMSFGLNNAYNERTLCATKPFLIDSTNKRVIFNEQAYVVFYGNTVFASDNVNVTRKSSAVATFDSSNNYYYVTINDNSQNSFISYNYAPYVNFHLSSNFKVGNISFDENKYRFFTLFKKYDDFTGEMDSFTYMNDKQQNKYSKFMLIFENTTNATYNFGYNSGFMYYNNTVFRFDDTFTVRQGFPTSIQTQTIFPIIYQFNEDLSFPEYDGTTVDYTRLYFTNDKLGQTNGIYTFYRDATDWAYTTYEQVQGVWTGSSEYDIVNFDINIEPVIPGEEEEETTNEDINNSINDMNNNIMDETPPDTSSLSDTAGWLPAGPVDSILNLPLTLLQRLNNSVNGTCSPLRLPLPFVNQTMELPCLNTVYSRINGLNTFMTFFSTVISTLILYYYFKNLYEWVGKKVSLNNDESWGGI